MRRQLVLIRILGMNDELSRNHTLHFLSRSTPHHSFFQVLQEANQARLRLLYQFVFFLQCFELFLCVGVINLEVG